MSADSNVDGDPSQHTPPLGVLDVVRDREDDSADDAVVVNTPPVPADEWVVHAPDGAVTVAGENPGYDPDAEVVVVVFRDELGEARPGFTETTDALRLAEADDVDTYAFPPGRLRRVATICPDSGNEASPDNGQSPKHGPAENTPTLRDDLDAIAAAVEELNVDGVAVDTFREAVVVEKLGVEYEIAADGAVDNDDRLAEELEAAVEGVVAE